MPNSWFLASTSSANIKPCDQVAKAKLVAIWTGIGIAFAGIGTILITLMVVHLLHEVLDLPLWGSYGIVGIVLIAIGGGFLYGAKSRL